MAVKQREVYLLPHPINPKEQQEHPFIVLSVEDSNANESTFIAVMITSSQLKIDDHSFHLTDAMFEHRLDKQGCHARMHLMMLCLNKEIVGRKLNTMKETYFKQLMKSIGDLIFHYDFTPLPNP
jgi:PemK-like, MazF-like toxin of type II toxin-antitoxin system